MIWGTAAGGWCYDFDPWMLAFCILIMAIALPLSFSQWKYQSIAWTYAALTTFMQILLVEKLEYNIKGEYRFFASHERACSNREYRVELTNDPNALTDAWLPFEYGIDDLGLCWVGDNQESEYGGGSLPMWVTVYIPLLCAIFFGALAATMVTVMLRSDKNNLSLTLQKKQFMARYR